MSEQQQTAAPAAAPSVSVNDVDFSSFSQQELQNALAAGDLSALNIPAEEIPATVEAPDPAAASPAGDAAASTEQPSGDQAAAQEGEDAAPAPAEAEPETEQPASPSFTFTPDGDDATFATELEAFKEAFEFDPATQFMFDRLTKQVEDLKQMQAQAAEFVVPEASELQQKAVKALSNLVTRIPDGEGRYLPNTRPVIEFLSENYAQELPHLIEDFMMLPSQRYNGLTMYQEYLKDVGRLNDQQLHQVDQFITSGGQVPLPSYVPQGIDQRFTEAYWKDPDRGSLEEAVIAAVSVIQDPLASGDEKANAQYSLQRINSKLADVQYGIDARKSQVTDSQTQAQRMQAEIQTRALQGYAETTIGLARSFSEKLAEKLTMFDPVGAQITATAYASLINNALSDDDQWAKAAQDDLAKQGITFNWREGRQALDDLYRAHIALAAAESDPRTSKATLTMIKDNRVAALKELKRLDLDLMGKIGKKAIGGAAQVLKATAAAAPKVPAVRPRVQPGQAPGADTPPASQDIAQYDDPSMTAAKLQSLLGEMKSQMGQQLPGLIR